jgi:hypothetical protein
MRRYNSSSSKCDQLYQVITLLLMCLIPIQGFASADTINPLNESDSQSHFTDSCSDNCSAIPEVTVSNLVVESETAESSLDDEFQQAVIVLSARLQTCNYGAFAIVLAPKRSYGITNPPRAPPHA